MATIGLPSLVTASAVKVASRGASGKRSRQRRIGSTASLQPQIDRGYEINHYDLSKSSV